MLALMVIRTSSEVGLPSTVLVHMLFNVILDFFLGLVPLLGDIADMAYKANTRNAILLEDHLRQRGAENLRRQGQTNVPDPSLGPVEVEEGIVDDSDPGVGSSRTWVGNQRGGQYDVEAQRGAPQPSNTSNNGYGRSNLQKPPKVSRGGSSRGHARLYSQETGTT